MKRSSKLLIFAAVLGASLALAACGDDEQGASATDTTAFSDQQTTSTAASAGDKPEVQVPDGPPPDKLEIKDLKEGSGPAAKTGDQLSVQYVGVDYETGEEFDSSYDTGQPFDFQLGSGQVIKGWDEGLVGMKKGGRRQLIIPPDLAYGAQGQPPSIQPNATLIFVIDLVNIQG